MSYKGPYEDKSITPDPTPEEYRRAYQRFCDVLADPLDRQALDKLLVAFHKTMREMSAAHVPVPVEWTDTHNDAIQGTFSGKVLRITK